MLQIQDVKHRERISQVWKEPFATRVLSPLITITITIFPLNMLFLEPNTKQKKKTPTVWNRIDWGLGWIDKITLKK